MKILLSYVLMLFLIVACSKTEEQKSETSENPNEHKVVVQEVLQASSYTYLRVSENDKEYWIAVTKFEAEEGMTLYWESGMEMQNFESKDLKRTFESVFFVDKISAHPMSAPGMVGKEVQGTKPTIEKEDIKIDKAEGGLTIAELYADKSKYENKVVKIRGKVTKYNPEIMGKNWIHIQDGTGDENSFDLTITSADGINVGETAVFEGVVALNKDFGAGYSYALIMEEAKITK